MSCAPPEGVPPGVRLGRTECKLDNDARLLASIGAIVAHAAYRAGLPEAAQQEIGAAAGEAAGEIAASDNGAAPGNSSTRLIVEEFADRMEISIDSGSSAKSEGIRKRLEGKAADCMRCEAREGRVHVTLLKPCSAAKSGAAS